MPETSLVAQLSLHSPVGALTVTAVDDVVVSVDWGWARDQAETPLLREAVAQFHAYFDGKLGSFALPHRQQGTALQQAVWRAMTAIPLGRTRTYGDMARELGGSARSVGTACGANVLPILVPCHRVVGASGPGGYSAGEGAGTKRQLLAFEAAAALV